jgi:hypothetical protein
MGMGSLLASPAEGIDASTERALRVDAIVLVIGID